MFFTRSFLGVLSLVLLILFSGASLPVAAQETLRVAVPLLPTPAFPQMLATDKGFFQKRGLKVEFIRINSEPTTYQALIFGDIQATSGAPVFLTRSRRARKSPTSSNSRAKKSGSIESAGAHH
jgi:ABC-type nitrate/sulfonate/bicarbonate transport system substrate-binding protein